MAVRLILHVRGVRTWDGTKPLTLTLSRWERGQKRSLEYPLQCL
jgi:hypothetical protein